MADNCNCGETCVGGLTCHCNDTTTFICPGGNCSIPNNNNNCNCGCNCNLPDECLPDEHRVPRLIAPSRDTHTNWNDKDPVILEGVLGFTKNRIFDGSLEYFIGDGVHKYSELPKYGGAEASILSKAYTLVLRDGNGKIDSASLPDATASSAGAVKASTTTAPNTVVKSDGNGSLSGWKDAIINAIIASDGSGGLATDANGNMVVDFDQMPTDKFEALLKSLKMQIPLEANLDLYVDKNHAQSGDTIVDGRGTAAKPFKTIQACVNFATQNYALGTHNVNIRVAAGTYSESLTLPTFTRTTGNMILRAADYTNPPTISNSSPVYRTIGITGGRWQLVRLNINGAFVTTDSDSPHYPGAIQASGGDTSVTILGCAISASCTGDASAYPYNLRTVFADSNATINLGTLEGYQNSLSCTKGNASASFMLLALRGGAIFLNCALTPDDGIMYDIPCSGDVGIFCTVDDQSKFNISGAGTCPQFSGTVTGKRYSAGNASWIKAPTNGFPGSIAGTVDALTYCWYSGPNLDE